MRLSFKSEGVCSIDRGIAYGLSSSQSLLRGTDIYSTDAVQRNVLLAVEILLGVITAFFQVQHWLLLR
jgi:hypothetical protein